MHLSGLGSLAVSTLLVVLLAGAERMGNVELVQKSAREVPHQPCKHKILIFWSITMINSEPSPTLLFIIKFPLKSAAACFTMESPNPVPFTKFDLDLSTL